MRTRDPHKFELVENYIKELKMNDLDKVSGGYLNFPKDEYGNYICPSCGGAINPQSLICGGCGASFGKSTPQETRMYE